jgi:hypothetical protein
MVAGYFRTRLYCPLPVVPVVVEENKVAYCLIMSRTFSLCTVTRRRVNHAQDIRGWRRRYVTADRRVFRKAVYSGLRLKGNGKRLAGPQESFHVVWSERRAEVVTLSLVALVKCQK